jgi:hypothetical protein
VGFTIGVTLKPGASEHLDSLIKVKEDEDAIAEQKQRKSKGTKSSKNKAMSCSNNKTCIKKKVIAKK